MGRAWKDGYHGFAGRKKAMMRGISGVQRQSQTCRVTHQPIR